MIDMMQEEDDLTQEMRALVVAEATQLYHAQLDKSIAKILKERPDVDNPSNREYLEGVVDGLEWAVRILRGDKSAS